MENFRAPNTEEWIFFSESVTKVLKNKPFLDTLMEKQPCLSEIPGFYKTSRRLLELHVRKRWIIYIFRGLVDRGSEQLRTALSFFEHLR
jgi:hypothetical protein